ncbi:metal ABC transporter ATP-binding protein [Chlamydiifrater phoenicopteri]|uniref:metal ABC transporter ATP-binding protein n=1 Tax=Chlamydiifrater phoenicopteri TaxID=2681469 RepID=UPI001BD0DA7E|nr:metal ABC transporter ATP-binding protein [Chlamydiifrater phoenicopteri]
MQTSDLRNRAVFWEVRNLCVNYERYPVLYDVSFSVSSGSLVAIVGPNGAGKSTLLKASLGLIKSFSGSVAFFGKKFKKVRKKVSYMPQRASVDWEFPITLMELVLSGAYGRKGLFRKMSREDREEANEQISRVGLEKFCDRQIGKLSGGQQQRAFLARALMQKADLYLMDELFSAIDISSTETAINILKQLKDAGKTVVVVHHDLEKVPEIFDSVVLLNKRLVAAGPIEECFNSDTIKQTFGKNADFFDRTLKLSKERRSGEI